MGLFLKKLKLYVNGRNNMDLHHNDLPGRTLQMVPTLKLLNDKVEYTGQKQETEYSLFSPNKYDGINPCPVLGYESFKDISCSGGLTIYGIQTITNLEPSFKELTESHLQFTVMGKVQSPIFMSGFLYWKNNIGSLVFQTPLMVYWGGNIELKFYPAQFTDAEKSYYSNKIITRHFSLTCTKDSRVI
jgi:hypothetical protein